MKNLHCRGCRFYEPAEGFSVPSYYPHALWRKILRKIGQNKYAKQMLCNRDCSILVILHLFYPESWKEIKQYLMNLDGYSWDLYVTYPMEYQDQFDFSSIRAFKPEAQMLAMENRGYDIAPFIMALKQINLNRYDVVFKIQSKGVRRKWVYIYKQLFYGRDWFVNLYEGILGSRTVHKTIDALYRQKNVGLVCAENLYVMDPKHKQHLVVKGLAKRGIEVDTEYRFVAGTCFAAKAEPLKVVQEINVTSSDFEYAPSSRGLSLAHIMERYLSIAITGQNYYVTTNRVNRLRRWIKQPLLKVFDEFSSERLFQTSYQIDDEFFKWKLDCKLIDYKIRQIPVGQLEYNCPPYTHLPIVECFPYRYLTGDRESYDEYSRFHYENDLPMMTKERFRALITSLEKSGYDETFIIIVNDRNEFVDGQHRACYLAWKYGLDYSIKVLEIKYIKKVDCLKLFATRHLQKQFQRVKSSVLPSN